MFKSVRVKNFRAITELKVDDLRRVNLFVGRNACGKTTLLETVFFLVGATNPKLPVNVNTFRGFPYVSRAVWRTYFHNMNTDVPIEIHGEDSESGEQECLLIRARMEDSVSNGTPSSELSPSRMRVGSDTGTVMNGLLLDYTTSAKPASREQSEVFLKDDELMVRGARERSVRGSFVIPLPLDLTNRFSDVQRRKQVSEAVALLKEIEPAIEDLRLADPGGVIYADIGAPELIPVNLMGGGIVKFLSVALFMLDFQNGFVLIDEIENGLEHSALRRLWEAIFNWAQKLNIQVFATTHSVECIRAFSDCAEGELFGQDARLVRIERRGDKFRAVEYTRELLAESLESEWEVR